MKCKTSLLSALSAVVVAINTVGATENSFSVMGTGVPGNSDQSRTISFAELKARCQSPDSFDIQRAPQNIKIQCTDIRREFVAAPPGEVPLSGARRVITTVFADKFHVNAQARDLPIFQKSGSCLRFREVEKTLTIERPISCAEILGMKAEVTDFCSSALDAAKGANPKLVEIRELPGAIDTCSSLSGVATSR